MGNAAVLIVLAMAAGCAIEATIKGLDNTYPIQQVLFLRMLFAVPVLLPAVLRHGPTALRSASPLGQAGLTVLTLAALALWFGALPALNLADATALSFTTPLFLVMLAPLMQAEGVSTRQWLAVAVGFAGAMMVVRPDGTFGWAALAVLGSALVRAVGLMVTRRFVLNNGVYATVAWQTLLGLAVSACLLPLGWVSPTTEHWGRFAAIGLLGGTSQLLLMAALRRAPMSNLAPFDYVRLPLAAALSLIFFHQVPDAWSLAGSAVIIVAAIVAARG